jgi:transcription termination/antitermination protein NusA
MDTIDAKALAMAVKQIAEEKNLPEDVVKEVLESALAAAYRKDFGDREQEVRAEVNLTTGHVDVYTSMLVVETVEDEYTQMSLADAKKINKKAAIDETVELHDEPQTFGRVAAMTAKQVILQRLREAEREVVMTEFEDKIGTVINAVVSRIEGRMIKLEIGKAQGIMPMSEQIPGEHLSVGSRLKVYLKEVERGPRGPQLILSRANTGFIEYLFRQEVPEMESGAVAIKAIVREAGVRTKMAVTSTVQGVDPVGTFVGGHGTRVQAVMGEIGDREKIDIIVWDEDTKTFIKNALSPTQVVEVVIDEAGRAKVTVSEDQLSIAIGKGGQNVRLASKLTEHEIDIISQRAGDPVNEDGTEAEVSEKVVVQKLKRKDELENGLLAAIEELGQ